MNTSTDNQAKTDPAAKTDGTLGRTPLPIYETRPAMVPKGARPDVDEATAQGVFVSHDDALRLTSMYMGRIPVWSLHDKTTSGHPGIYYARMYLTYPGEPETTAYLLGATSEDEYRLLESFLYGNFVDAGASTKDPSYIITHFLPMELA